MVGSALNHSEWSFVACGAALISFDASRALNESKNAEVWSNTAVCSRRQDLAPNSLSIFGPRRKRSAQRLEAGTRTSTRLISTPWREANLSKEVAEDGHFGLDAEA